MKGIYIASLNSQKLKETIRSKDYYDFSKEVDELDVYVFDNYETLNGIFFNGNNAYEQKKIIEGIIIDLEKHFINKLDVKIELIRNTKEQKKLSEYLKVVYSEYYSNSKFNKHCINQVFSNLQPKLKKISVLNNKSELIELLIPFLLIEIALFLKIFYEGDYSRIFSMEKEMDVIIAIKNHKYFAFDKYLKHGINYTKILID